MKPEEEIRLHSPAMQSIMERRLPRSVRWGIAAVCTLLLILAAAAWTLPLPGRDGKTFVELVRGNAR